MARGKDQGAADAGRDGGTGARGAGGARLPRQVPAQQASSSSSRGRDAAATCPGAGAGRRLAALGISALAGGSGLRVCAAPTSTPRGGLAVSLCLWRAARGAPHAANF